MKRLIPVQLLHLLENWLLNCYSCVKWADSFSQFFQLYFGVMQGSVMSPLLFAVYADNLAKSCDCSRGIYIALYADDILLLTPTVSELQSLLNTCERELQALDLVINVKKLCCLRIGPRNDVNCERLCSLYIWHIPAIIIIIFYLPKKAMDERGQILRHLSSKFKTFQNLYRTFQTLLLSCG